MKFHILTHNALSHNYNMLSDFDFDIDMLLPPLTPLNDEMGEEEFAQLMLELESIVLFPLTLDDWEEGIIPELLYRIKTAYMEIPDWSLVEGEPFWLTHLKSKILAWISLVSNADPNAYTIGKEILIEIQKRHMLNLTFTFERALNYAEKLN